MVDQHNARVAQAKRHANHHQTEDRPKSAIPQSPVRHEPVAAPEGTRPDKDRFLVRIVSRRTRLLDPDNLIGGCKYFIDTARYAGLIPNDSPEDIRLEITQEKVKHRPEECTFIEILKDVNP
jgi:hypothetical protein